MRARLWVHLLMGAMWVDAGCEDATTGEAEAEAEAESEGESESEAEAESEGEAEAEAESEAESESEGECVMFSFCAEEESWYLPGYCEDGINNDCDESCDVNEPECACPPTDIVLVSQTCEDEFGAPNSSLCEDGYICWGFSGIVLDCCDCRLPCSESCDCPTGSSCNTVTDKAGSWRFCEASEGEAESESESEAEAESESEGE